MPWIWAIKNMAPIIKYTIALPISYNYLLIWSKTKIHFLIFSMIFVLHLLVFFFIKNYYFDAFVKSFHNKKRQDYLHIKFVISYQSGIIFLKLSFKISLVNIYFLLIFFHSDFKRKCFVISMKEDYFINSLSNAINKS